MRRFSVAFLPLFALLAAWPLAGSAAELVPLSPAMAERLLGSGAAVTSELQQLIDRAGADGAENLAALADTGSPDWRLYYRDRQILFAVPSRRNLTAGQKKQGEEEARKLAVVLLQQRFSQLLKLDAGAGLEPESVRVVFIEPAAHEIAVGTWGACRNGFGRCGQGGVGDAGTHAGFAGTPLPFAPAGWWPAAGGGYQGGCGCR
jgi:hypothetical protein